MVLRAISLAAVMILVWSTRLKPALTACARTIWRTRTTSSPERRSMLSDFSTFMQPAAIIDNAPDEGEALVDIECGAHAAELEPELDQGDGHRRPHADDHGRRIEHAAHGGDVVEHAADEGIDDLQGRDVDHDAAGARRDDAVGEILLQLHRQAVVHVDLDRDQQAIADLEDRDLAHGLGAAAAAGRSVMCLLRRRSASSKASARVDFDTTLRSRPRCTMVWAICGRMPLMMQSAPMRR